MTISYSELTSEPTAALLGTESRRQVVAFLLEVEGTWRVRELAAELVRLDPTVTTDIDSHAERLAIRLYHCDLPKLADADALDFDSEAKTVAPGPRLSTLGARLVDADGHSERSRPSSTV